MNMLPIIKNTILYQSSIKFIFYYFILLLRILPICYNYKKEFLGVDTNER